MRILSSIHYSEWTLKRKLFGYMLLLATILLSFLLTGLILFGRFDNTSKNIYYSLDLQAETFEKDISTYFDHLAASGLNLSRDMTLLLENYIDTHHISFDELTDSQMHITEIQHLMIQSLHQQLFQENASGIFVMLDTTINSSLDNSEISRSGIYLQVSGYETTNQNVLLYRGLSEVGKTYDIMPHRKWRLEFRTDLFPDYEAIRDLADKPLDKAFLLTDSFTLPNTSDDAVLLVVPVVGSDQTFYGVCGFEISESYFMTYHAQTSFISHLTCLLASGDHETLHAENGLSCGVKNGYYRVPKSTLTISDMGNNLMSIEGDIVPYVGVTRQIQLTPNNEDYTLAAMMLKSDYTQALRKNFLQSIFLFLLMLFFMINCCFYFSRRFLSPILYSLEQLKSDQRTSDSSNIIEIKDLFAFLDEKDKEYDEMLNALNHEKQKIQSEKERIQKQYDTAQAEISRLAYSRKQEIDPNDYQNFIEGIRTLTPTERKIFNHYLNGKTVKEILDIASIKESTLRYHNQNIYGKLGVNSLKQLLRYAALMNQETASNESEEKN